MFAHRTERTVLRQKLVDTFRMEYVTARKLPNDGDSVFEIGEADVTARLKISSSVVARGSDIRSFAPDTGTGSYAPLVESSATSHASCR